MTKEEIIELAREAGAGEWGESVIPAMMDIYLFANLVAAKERERCAMVCDEKADAEVVSLHVSSGHCLVTRQGMYRCAEAIRSLKCPSKN